MPTRKSWAKAKTYFKKWTKREEVYDLSVGGTAKKARFESIPQVREQPEPEEREDNNTIGSDDAIREYIDNVSAASMAKEERIQEMAEDARRKDDQFAAMLARIDAKDKQIKELIMQVAAMKSS